MDHRDPPDDLANDALAFAQLPLVGPLLRALRVQSDEDLLALDLQQLAAMPGVGRGKVRQVASLQEQARSRAVPERTQVAAPTGGSEYHSLPLVGRLLRELGVSSDRHLLELDLAALARRKGVGESKVLRIGELQAEASERLEQAPSDEGTPPVAPWADLPAPLMERPPREVLGLLSKRLSNLLDDEQLSTVGQLAAWVAQVDPAARTNYGRGTHQEILSKLKALAERGPDAAVFGGARPETVEVLAEAFLSNLDEPDRTVFQMRYQEEQTLLEIGRVLGVTRERARQRLVRAVDRARPGWGPLAGELLRPARDALEGSGGVALTEEVLGALGNPSPWMVALTTHLWGEGALRLEVRPGLATDLAADAFESLRRNVRTACHQALEAGGHTDQLRRTLSDFGVTPRPSHLAEFLERFLGIRVEGPYAWSTSQEATARVERVLAKATRPMTTQEVVDALQASGDEPGASSRVVSSRLARSGAILAYGHGVWIHDETAGWPVESRALAVNRCLPALRTATGQAIDAEVLRSRLVQEGIIPEVVTGYMLRDVLVRSGRVRTWPSVTDVAYRTADARRTSILDWLEELASELPQPVDRSELVALVALRSGYAESSIGMRLATHPGFLGLGDGRVFSVGAVFGGMAALQAEADRMFQALPTDDLVTPLTLMRRVADPSPALAAHGPELGWATLRTHPSVRTRVRGKFAWRADLGTHVAEALWRAGLFDGPEFSFADFREAVHQRYGVDRSLLWGLHIFLTEAVQAGLLTPVGSDSFSCVHDSPQSRTGAA